MRRLEILTRVGKHTVCRNEGPLVDADLDDVDDIERAVAQVWLAIAKRAPIWCEDGVLWFNADQVIAVREVAS